MLRRACGRMTVPAAVCHNAHAYVPQCPRHCRAMPMQPFGKYHGYGVAYADCMITYMLKYYCTLC